MFRPLSTNDHARSSASDGFFRLVALLFLFVGALGVIISVVVLVKTAAFVTRSQVTVARIDKIEPRAGRSVQYVPVYSFMDSSNIQHRNKGILCGRGRWRVGQQVPVRYSPGDPGRSSLNTFHEIWMVPTLFLAFSAGHSLLSFSIYRRFSKTNKPLDVTKDNAPC